MVLAAVELVAPAEVVVAAAVELAVVVVVKEVEVGA
jgi:hypothetical protein